MSGVYEAETRGVLVRVDPTYLPQQSNPDAGQYAWSYTVDIVNCGTRTFQLLARHWIITDAGWMALSADRGTAGQAVDQYYGIVCDPEGRPYDDLVVLRANQEHGIIAARPGSAAKIPELRIGDRVRILPNHACATAAQHDQYYVMDEKNAVAATWPRFRGW